MKEPKILGVPYEEGTYWRRGAKHGPRAVMAEFEKIRPMCIATGSRLPRPLSEFVTGELILDPYSTDAAFDAIEAGVANLLEIGHPVISVGGDHSISIPTIRAFSKRYGASRLGVIHVDAHSDTFPPINGFRYHHGSVFRSLIEDGWLEARNLVQLGVRGSVRDGGLDFVSERGIHCVSFDDWKESGFDVARYVPQHCDFYYLSFDIDAVDPAFAPGTGTPVPGGLSSDEAIRVMREIGENVSLVGADFVEFAPVYDHSGITGLLGAYLIFELIAHTTFV